jgi:ADP-L-glycero-D-manno-heptose 6-epimerase
MIVVTGAAGFIGSYLTAFLNQKGYQDLLLVDKGSYFEGNKNLEGKEYRQTMDRNDFIPWFKKNFDQVDFVFHIGARTDTTEFDEKIFQKLNIDYSKEIWKVCAKANIGLVYASSAATYGLGELGYKDDHDIIEKLKPLNPYGRSKNDFDIWALKQSEQPPFWCGLKFFNVYGPNEYHKGRMASVIWHAFNQISETGKMKLFMSHNSDYKDGEQQRDFIYVRDLVNVCYWMMENRPANGLYNLGSGKARTFRDLVESTFKAMGKKIDIEFIPTPEDIRDKYQYFTEADMSKLIAAGYTEPFTSLEEGVEDYVKHYLSDHSYF